MSRLADERSTLQSEIERLKEGERERARREDLLTYQLEEIAAARLVKGEDDELEAERVRLAHIERLAQGVQEAYAALDEGDGSSQSAVDLAGELYSGWRAWLLTTGNWLQWWKLSARRSSPSKRSLTT